MKPTTLAVISIAVAQVSAMILWWVGRSQGPGLPFYADREGKMLQSIRRANTRRQRLGTVALLLVTVASGLALWATVIQ